MTARLKNGLLLIIILVILFIISATFIQSTILRIILGLPFLLFFPGYALVAALFPGRNGLGGIERLALSFALSLAVVACIGIILHYTPWGIRLYPILGALTGFVLTTLIIAWVRRRRLAEGERFTFSLILDLFSWRREKRVDKILSVIVAAVILATAGTIGYGIAMPRQEEKFTEFYILGPEGKAEGYPEELTVGEKATIILGIRNHEREDVIYRVEIVAGGNKGTEIAEIPLGQEETWEREASFEPAKVGQEQKVEFVLYKNGEPYRWLHLWINVKEQ